MHSSGHIYIRLSQSHAPSGSAHPSLVVNAGMHGAGAQPSATYRGEDLRIGGGLAGVQVGAGGGIGSPRGGGSGAMPSPPRREARERELLAAYGQLNDATETLNERAVAVMKRMSDKLTGRDYSQVRAFVAYMSIAASIFKQILRLERIVACLLCASQRLVHPVWLPFEWRS